MPSSGSPVRVLITGALGFVGPHVVEALRQNLGRNLALVATAKEAGRHPSFGSIEKLDVTDAAATNAAVVRSAPTHVVHLAGIAAPAAANVDAQAAWRVHVQGTLNLAHAILEEAPYCWLLHVGSGLVYGDSAKTGVPLDESALLAPTDDYSVTKAAADLALGALARRGLKCIRLRPFNHTGPGQTEDFVVPAFARQVVRIEAGLTPPVIRVGNLEAQRDFLDVRDVAHAYALAVRRSEDLEPGLILNIASGIGRRVSELLEGLLAGSHARITVQEDPERFRSGDLPRIVGNADRARKLLSWRPRHLFKDTLAAVLDDCRARVARV